MYILNHIFNWIQSGAFVALVGVIGYIFQQTRPMIKSHVRNNHERSLMNCANRLVPALAKIAQATPADRKSEAISELCVFASKNHIKINPDEAKHFIEKAIEDYKSNGGSVKKTIAKVIDDTDSNSDNVNDKSNKVATNHD